MSQVRAPLQPLAVMVLLQDTPFEYRYNGHLGHLPVWEERVGTGGGLQAIARAIQFLVGCVNRVASALHRRGAQISISILQVGLTIERKV